MFISCRGHHFVGVLFVEYVDIFHILVPRFWFIFEKANEVKM